MYRIYLVEDDRVIAKTIADKLTAWNFTVKCTQDFSSILGEFVEFQPHLVLMDITLPFFNGYHWCHDGYRIFHYIIYVGNIFPDAVSNDFICFYDHQRFC